MILFGLLACGGDPLVAEEAVWWGPVDELEAAVGLDIVDLPAGEPIGYWPRIVLYDDRIEVDNRAWFLSLPDDLRASQPALLREPERVADVVDGEVPESVLRGRLISGLYEALRPMANAHRELAEETGDEALAFDGRVVVVPSAGTSTTLLLQVLFTAGQSMYDNAAMAGDTGGRLRSATAWDGATCSVPLIAEPRDDGFVLQAARIPFRGAQCPSPPGELGTVVRELVEACARVHDRIADEVAADGLDPEQWRCATVHFMPAETSVRVDRVLPGLAGLHAHHPTIRQGLMLGINGGVDAPCDQRPTVAELTPAQLQAVCQEGSTRRRLTQAIGLLGEGRAEAAWSGKLSHGIDLREPEWTVDRTDVTGFREGFADEERLALRQHASRVAFCAARAEGLDRDQAHTFQGEVVFDAGRITEGTVTFPDATAAACAEKGLRYWRWPEEITGPRTIEIDVRWALPPLR
jgi:hypothetical protein